MNVIQQQEQGSTLIIRVAGVTATHDANVTSAILSPRLGNSQRIPVQLSVTAAGAATITVELDVTLYDKAFEQTDLFGKEKQKQKKEQY